MQKPKEIKNCFAETDNILDSVNMLPKNCVPVHLGIIMDGNGRWAKMRGLDRSKGHKEGTKTVKAIIEECVRQGVSFVTLYTFSKENWSRPVAEVSFLFDLLVDFLTKELPYLKQHGVRLRVVGDMDKLPFAAKKALEHGIKSTQNGTATVVNLALNYSGREEIVQACQAYVAAGNTLPELTPELLANYLYTAGQPDPDLIIRTSGEQRLSNFLPFQSAYSELYFTETLWPDFTPAMLREAFMQFGNRERRFGGVSQSQQTENS